MGQSNVKNLGNGGTMDGDVTITGDLTVSGGIGLSLSEVIEGTSTIDVTNTEAFLVRKNGDGGDVFTVDTTNGTVTLTQASANIGLSIDHNANERAINIDAENTSERALNIECDANTSGNIAKFYSAAGNTTARNLVYIHNDDASATGAVGLKIQQDSTGAALVAMGNVGIGIASPTSGANWSQFLQINHTTNSALVLTETDSTQSCDVATNGAGMFIDVAGHADATNNVINFRTEDTNSNYSPTTRMTIDSTGLTTFTGNVKADISGMTESVIIGQNSGSTTYGLISFNGSVTDSGKLGLTGGGGTDKNLYYDVPTGGSHIFRENATNTGLTIDASQNVIIQATKTLWLDGGGDTGIRETSANNMLLVAAGTTYLNLDGANSKVVFNDDGGNIDFIVEGDNNANLLFVDAGNDRIGIGTNSPDTILNLVDSGGSTSTNMRIKTFSDTTGVTSTLHFDKSHNDTVGTLTTTTDGSYLGLIEFRGVDSGGNLDDGAYIAAIQSGSASTRIPTKLQFACYSDSAEKIPLVIDFNSRISLSNNDGGAFNTILGSNAGNSSIDSGAGFNVIIGDNAANDGAKTANYDNNTIIGYSAGEDGTSHADCVAVGFKAMETHNGSRNVAIGSAAMADTDANSDTKGSSDNVFIGHQSGGGTWTGDDSNFNVGVGGYTMDAALDGALYNVAVGYQALTANTEGDYNTVLGAQAGLDSTGGAINTLIGFRAGYDITGGIENTFVGASAGQLTTAVVGATLIGREAGGGGVITTAANHTTAVGYQALYSLTSGAGNTAVGYQCLDATDDGAYNTAVGYQSLSANCGNENTAIGYQALLVNTAGDNTAVGAYALKDMVEGFDNVAIGMNALGGALDATSDGSEGNIAIGKAAMGGAWVTAVSNNNVAIGHSSMDAAMNGANLNVAVGKSSLTSLTTGDSNTSIGSNSGYTLSTGERNTFIGNSAGYETVDVDRAICIGYNAGSGGNMNSDADGTTAIGYNSLAALTSGQRSTAVGYYALANCDDGDNNTAIGWEALEANAGDSNTAVGAQSLKACTGGLNTTLGYQAATALVSGTSNTVIGARAMGAADGGEQNNVIIGTDAGDVINNDAADGNVIIGHDADPSGSAGTNQIVIGQATTGQADNSVTLGNADVTAVYMASDSGATVHCASVALAGGILTFSADSELTISSGAVTATKNYHTLDTEGGAGTDDLDTINGGSDGQLLILRDDSDSRDVTAKDGTGNLALEGDFTFTNSLDTLTLLYCAGKSKWLEISRSNNA